MKIDEDRPYHHRATCCVEEKGQSIILFRLRRVGITAN